MKVGIDIGGTHISVGLVSEDGKILAKQEQDLQRNMQSIEEEIVSIITEKIDNLICKNEIQMIGVACCSGSIENNVIKISSNLGVKNFELGKILEEKYKVPIFIKNDAKCAAIAEKQFGCLKKYQDSIFFTIGTGIGGAIHYEGKLLQPIVSDTFEAGHMIIQKDGKQCNCGNKGCFERYASIRALKEMVTEKYNIEKQLTGLELRQYIISHKEETKMQEIMQEYIQNLSIGIANILRIYKAEVIGLGGSFAYYEDIFVEPLKKQLQEYTHHGYVPQIEIAQLKNDAGIIGATMLG